MENYSKKEQKAEWIFPSRTQQTCRRPLLTTPLLRPELPPGLRTGRQFLGEVPLRGETASSEGEPGQSTRRGKKADPKPGRPLVLFIPNLAHIDVEAVRLRLHNVLAGLVSGQLAIDDVDKMFEGVGQTNHPKNSTPKELPIPDAYDPEKHGRASAYLMTAWRDWLEAGRLTQKILRKKSPALMAGLDSEFQGRRKELRELLPTRGDELSSKMEKFLGRPPRPEERKNLARTIRSMETYGAL